jgi:hypothetical protein
LTSSPELHFVQQLAILQQQNPNKYLQQHNVNRSSSLQTGKEGVERKLTSQQLASRLDDAKDERFTLFTMDNPGHQTGYFLFKGGDFLHIATSLASLFYSLQCLAFGQR